MSQVHPRSQSLEEILNPTSVMVLHAKMLTPFRTLEKKTFPNEEKPIPDFTVTVHHYNVIEVLHNVNAWAIKPLDNIAVYSADWTSKMSDHKKYYSIGLSKSTYQYYYEHSADLEEAEEAIIFITPNWMVNTLEYMTNGAFHDVKDVETVKQLLAKKHP